MPVESQQPFGHDVASHTQVPLVASHASPDPQAAHAAPFLPQAAAVAVTHCPAELQQPLLHEPPPHEHDPLLQVWPAAQATQAAPCVPHSAAVVGVTQLSLLSQHPFAQEVALQAPVEEPPVPPLPVLPPPPLPPWPVCTATPPVPPSGSAGCGVMHDAAASRATAMTRTERCEGMRKGGPPTLPAEHKCERKHRRDVFRAFSPVTRSPVMFHTTRGFLVGGAGGAVWDRVAAWRSSTT